ncbi:MAG: hypothetical protein EHM68_16675 [Lysobacterales bacterium]|nr:MAG: hypothetical protein EHM68_16675 [Xanthomonadales bacterium]
MRFALLAAALCWSAGCAALQDAPTGPAATDAATRVGAPSPARTQNPPLALSPQNLLQNPSFEAGRDPWWSFAGPDRPNWADFSIGTDQAHWGESSARLDLTSEGYDDDTRIYGAIQEVAPATLPRRLAGWYRVENWERGASSQYLQVVVVVWNAANVRRGRGNVQLSYVLAGLSKPPFGSFNRSFEFLGAENPTEGEWVRFERDLHADFLKHYGVVPENFSSLRVLFEVRFDGRASAKDAEANAQVWYDDLYLGD